MRHPVISVVIPTYNRDSYLSLTLKSFKEQIVRNKDKATLIVCNNASTDNTSQILEVAYQKYPWFEYKNYEEHVDVGYSITRANNTANGEYILMWGDDDLPVPYFIDIILDCIESNDFPDFIHYNRLCGYDDNTFMINKLCVVNPHIGEGIIRFNTINDFLNRFSLDITFLSSIIFKRENWLANQNIDTSSHYGYEFLGKVLLGITKNIIYIQYPLCIQRKPANRPWMNKSPYYRFIGIPNMYKDFEAWGLIKSSKKLWITHGNTMRDFLSIMSQTSMYKCEYRPLRKQMMASQPTVFRKLATLFFICVMPAFIYKTARKFVFKN